jgi:hypothetical protein
VQTGERVGAAPGARISTERRPARRSRFSPLTGGGTDGNRQLTATTGVILVALLAVIGVTILRIGQLISVHLFVGLLLIGPVALKIATTGYRFLKYYSGNAVYRRQGPPQVVMRMIAPVVVLTTVVVFASGIVLMFQGPDHRDPWLLIHKASFIIWIAFTALHVLGHLPGLGRGLKATRPDASILSSSPGSAGRWIALTGALVAGVVLAVVLIPDFSVWTAARHSGFGDH